MTATIHSSRLNLTAVTFLAFILAAGTGIAMAGEISTTLTGDQEVPPVQTSASGKGTIKVEDDKSVRGTITTSDINGTGAHIHEAAPGKNGPDIISLKKTGDNEWSVPNGSKLSDAQYDAFKAGNLYINVHSEANPNGEIRGQLKR